METPLLTPRGLNVPCNLYCTDDQHAVIVLGKMVSDDGSLATPGAIIAGPSAYYASLGWQVLRAKHVEADRETIVATMRQADNAGPVRIEPYDIEEYALPVSLETYEPWMLVLIPAKETT